MAIKLYGIPQSRSARCLWMLEELGVHYENVPVHFIGDAQRPEYLKINPNGRVPALDDGGLILFESLAINLHLARKYGFAGGLWPPALDDQSRAIQWSVWAMTEVEPAIVKMLLNRLFYPHHNRSETQALEGLRALAKAIGVLEGALQSRPHLLGERFTVADLNAYAVLAWDHPALRTPALDNPDPRDAAAVGRLDFDGAPRVAEWAQRCAERPALARVLAIR